MFIEEISELFCANKALSLQDILSSKQCSELWHTRYMIWYYLHCHKGIATSVIAKRFNRNRPSIFRGIRMLKHDMKHNKHIAKEYHDIVSKIEGATYAAPSDNMEE